MLLLQLILMIIKINNFYGHLVMRRLDASRFHCFIIEAISDKSIFPIILSNFFYNKSNSKCTQHNCFMFYYCEIVRFPPKILGAGRAQLLIFLVSIVIKSAVVRDPLRGQWDDFGGKLTISQ